MPDDVRGLFDTPLPRAPEGAAQAYDDFLDHVVPYSMGNDHPRFWGWYMGAGNPVGNLADLLASVLNPNLGGADHAPVLVEKQVVRWCAEAAGYPTDASGLLVTGASEANLVGLAVARSQPASARRLRTDGMPDGRRFAVYASTEVHSCHRKSCELLGLGSDALRMVPVRTTTPSTSTPSPPPSPPTAPPASSPLAVVASAGTINTGAVDDLDAMADLAEREGLWFHVDGAIGGFLALSGQRMPCAGSSAPTRWRWTSTSGCRRRSTSASPWCATSGRTAGPSRSSRSSSPTPRGESPPARCGSTSTASR